MIIHVVQPGDTLQSISDAYGVPLGTLIQANGLSDSYSLVIGQSIIIVYPESTYTVQVGDTLYSIANSHNVTVLQLLQNNSFLSDRTYIFPGDILVINYNQSRKITTHGNTVPYINKNTLRKTLPYLTYLSVLNYTATTGGEILTYYDDTELIQITKEYGVIPLMLLTTLTVQGEANIRTAFDLLLNEEYQNRQIDNILTILKTKGYYGVNISLEYISVSNFRLYENYFMKLSTRLSEEGYLVFAIINPNITEVGDEISYERADYTLLNQISHNIIFMNYEWARSTNPPSPISSIYNINAYLNYLLASIPPDKIIIGLATIGYDWELPYSAGVSSVTSLTVERAIELARNVGAIIQFDEKSQTPYFTYSVIVDRQSINHIVWFIDARSINALLNLVTIHDLLGTGIWNITVYNPQLWLVIISQYQIEKIPIN
ncbi:MAG: LysM peptidoglycan-binding domain-containing protein [Mobilitalea sp.]